MKIVFVALGFGIEDNLGGSVRVAAQNAKALVEAGHEVLYLCTNRKDRHTKLFPNIHSSIIEGVEVIYLDTVCIPFWPGDFGPHYVSIPSWVFKKIKKCQIIHLHEFRSFLSYKLTKLGSKFNIPVLMYPQGTYLHHNTKGGIKKIYDLLFTSNAANKYKYLIACTKSEAIDFEKNGIQHLSIRILPNGIKINSSPIKNGKNCFREKYLSDDRSPFILSIGRLDHIKGFELMIKALPFIPSDWKYVIVGPDQQNYSAILEKVISELGLENRVFITGALPSQSDIQDALAESAFLVVPSYFEAFGQVILEGCLAKKPIIISKGCRIASDFTEENALLVEPNVNEIAKACNTYIENRKLRDLMAERGHKFCIENFALQNVIKKLIAMYIQILDNNENERQNTLV